MSPVQASPAVSKPGIVPKNDGAPKKTDERKAALKTRALAVSKIATTVTPAQEGRKPGAVTTPRLKRKAQPAGMNHWRIVPLAVDHIDPCPFQPRLAFDEAEMEELVASVRQHGVQQPVIVRTAKADAIALKASKRFTRYELVTGERRLRASRRAGRRFVPAIIRDDLTDLQAAELALLENVQRSNLTVIEEARGYKRLMIEFRLKEERTAKKVGKSVQTVKDTLRLLALPAPVQALLSQKKLTAAHGRELLPLASHETVCILAAERIARDSLTALSLQTSPLPNAAELKSKKLIVELDSRTRFDWKEVCGNCPHKAYVRSGYASYCLNPAEWKAKQDEAIALQQQEAARVLEEARQEGTTTVETEKMPAGSYRTLQIYSAMPAGCSPQCACRGEAVDPADPTKKVAVCLDPARFDGLMQAEREARDEARKRQALALWNEAKDKLLEQQSLQEGRAVAPLVAALVALPVVQGEHVGYGMHESWQTMVTQIAAELQIDLPFEVLLAEDTEVAASLELLQGIDAEHLLLYVACLWLAQEALGAARYASAMTPCLNAVLGRAEPLQIAMAEDGDDLGDDAGPDGEKPDGTMPDSTEATDPNAEEEKQANSQMNGAADTMQEPDESAAPDAAGDTKDVSVAAVQISNEDIEGELVWPLNHDLTLDGEDEGEEKDDDELDGDLMDEILRDHGRETESEKPIAVLASTDEPYQASHN